MLIRDKGIGPGDFFKEYKENVILSFFFLGGGGQQPKWLAKKLYSPQAYLPGEQQKVLQRWSL